MNRLAASVFAFALAAAPALAQNPGDFLASQFAAHSGDPMLAASDMEKALAADPGNPRLRTDAFVLALLAGDSRIGRAGSGDAGSA